MWQVVFTLLTRFHLSCPRIQSIRKDINIWKTLFFQEKCCICNTLCTLVFIYTREKGKSKMEDKVGLTLACLNLKKLVKMRVGKPFYFVQMNIILSKDGILAWQTEKDKHHLECLSSVWEARTFVPASFNKLFS